SRRRTAVTSPESEQSRPAADYFRLMPQTTAAKPALSHLECGKIYFSRRCLYSGGPSAGPENLRNWNSSTLRDIRSVRATKLRCRKFWRNRTRGRLCKVRALDSSGRAIAKHARHQPPATLILRKISQP